MYFVLDTATSWICGERRAMDGADEGPDVSKPQIPLEDVNVPALPTTMPHLMQLLDSS